MAKKAKIIYFISAPAPTPEQWEAANKLSDMKHAVVFRNISGIDSSDTVEPADFFCGDVPVMYRQRLPKVPLIDLATVGKPAPVAPAPVVTRAPAPVAKTPPQPTAEQIYKENFEAGVEYAKGGGKLPADAPQAAIDGFNSVTPPPENQTPEQLERAKVDEWAKTATNAKLREALAHFKIPFESDDNKADLLTKFLSRP